jgi:hypothetical protein
VISNSPDAVRASDPCARSLDLVPFEFTRDVPDGIPFRSAHFKLDVLAAFGEGGFGDRPCLVDIDVLAVGPLPPNVAETDFLVYDITNAMVCDIGQGRMSSDLGRLTRRPLAAPRWFGGEFICASVPAYAALAREIDRIWLLYREAVGGFSHVSDETVVSAALADLAQDGWSIGDAGAAKVVTRWWSARTTFAQERLVEVADVALWHLPADKTFLAGLAEDGAGGDLRRAYAAYVKGRLRRRRLVNPFLNALRGERKHVGRL